MTYLDLAVWQSDAPLLDVPAATAALDRAAAAAAAGGARLLVCPELTLTGYGIGAAAHELAEHRGGPLQQAVADVARRHGLATVHSWPERDGDAVHIAAGLVSADGELVAAYRKSHLYGDETEVYTPGTGEPVVAEVDGFRVGLLVCYDVEFPEQVRRVALAGADVVAVPTALMRPYDEVSDVLVRARALENQVVLAYANRCGPEADLDFCGLSRVVGADGTDLLVAGRGPGVHVVRVTAEHLRSARERNHHLADRRPELYADLTRQETR